MIAKERQGIGLAAGGFYPVNQAVGPAFERFECERAVNIPRQKDFSRIRRIYPLVLDRIRVIKRLEMAGLGLAGR